MTLAHMAASAGFIAIIILSVGSIARDLRREWSSVRKTFGAPLASGAFSATKEAAHRPATDNSPGGGALEGAR